MRRSVTPRWTGVVPESLAEHDVAWLRETVFVVRHVGRGPRIVVQSDLTEDYMIATVPAAAVEPLSKVNNPHPLMRDALATHGDGFGSKVPSAGDRAHT